MKICVIGGGASGMIAAGISAKNNQVVLFEKNEKLGKKIYITGKGRCNVTNDCTVQEFLKNVVSNPKFLMSSLYTFTPQNLYELIENNGTKLKVERGNRVFPNSDKSSDIIKALEHFCIDNNVDIRYNTTVLNIIKDNKFVIKTNKGTEYFDKVIVATGGLSYPSTGSTGDGYKFATSFNHKLTDRVPGLVPIILNDNYGDLEGLSLKNVSLKTYINNKLKYEEFGEMLFTKNGISGPIVLTTSSLINRFDKNSIKLELDLKPALLHKTLDNRILRDFNANINKNIINVMYGLVPKTLAHTILKIVKINEYEKVNSITKMQRTAIVNVIKAFPLSYNGLEKIENAVITAGGVKVNEINPKTMESKLVSGLYFVGEVLDVDAFTGGFNLQIAFSTGYMAGKNLIED